MRHHTLFARLAIVHAGVFVLSSVAVPVAILSADPEPGWGWFVAGGCVVMLVALFLTQRLARSLSTKLERLTNQLTAGDPARLSIPDKPHEIRSLALAAQASVDRLARQLQDSNRDSEVPDQILSSMQEGVLLIDRGAVVYANDAARSLFGDHLAVHPALTGELPHDRPASFEFTLHHPRRRDLRVTRVRALSNRVLVVVQDVTESKQLEHIRRDFVANASHELKTPVAAILATAETLEHVVKEDPDAAQHFTATLAREARRLSDLVTDLLNLARLEQATASAETPLDLSKIVQDEIDAVGSRCSDRNLKLTARIPAPIHMRGRAEDLRALVANLLDNAIRYTEPGGSISVALSHEDDVATLIVRDTGSGIPQKDLPRIFERFFRVDQARARETGGTGLGLAIVRHAAEGHGGSVVAESELGVGSVFNVTLPTRRRE